MVNGIPEQPDRGDRVDALPEQVAGVEVAAYLRTYRRAQPQQLLRAVHDIAGVHLQADPVDAVFLGEGHLLLPEGDHLPLPLPGHQLVEVVRPGAGHPIRVFGVVAVARTAGEANHPRHVQPLGQPDGIPEILMVRVAYAAVGVQGVHVATEGADLQPRRRHHLTESLQRALVGQQRRRVAVALADEAAAADLHHLAAEAAHRLQGLLERLVVEIDREGIQASSQSPPGFSPPGRHERLGSRGWLWGV